MSNDLSIRKKNKSTEKLFHANVIMNKNKKNDKERVYYSENDKKDKRTIQNSNKASFLRTTTDKRKTNGQKMPKRSNNVSISRKIALDVLLDVVQRDSYASLALEQRLSNVEIDKRECALITQLVYGTIEQRYMLDYRIDQCLKDNKEIDLVIREILRMATYQIFYLDKIPQMAAVDEAVKLTRTKGMEGLTGFVNGILRSIIREEADLRWPIDDKSPEYLSLYTSTPIELCRILISYYGYDTSKDILTVREKENEHCIRTNYMRCTDERLRRLLADDGIEFRPGIIPGTYLVKKAGNLASLRAYQNGLFSIQGESSVLAAHVLNAKPGQTVLDTCAAPGGKTAVISEMMMDTGRVYAWDIHSHRVDMIRAMAKRLRIENIRPMVRDAQIVREEMNETVDGAIIDAPCTGTGVLREKPDIKFRITEESVNSLIETQKRILDATASMVKKNGYIVYSTCSILPCENDEQIRSFLKNHPEYKKESLQEYLPQKLKEYEGERGVQILPTRDGMDGFFIAKLKRIST